MNNNVKNMIAKSLFDIVGENTNKIELPKTEKEVIEKALKYSIVGNSINKEKLDYYTKNYGLDSRYKINIVATHTEENTIKGVLKYRDYIAIFTYDTKYHMYIVKGINYKEFRGV